ncbi:mucin-1-like [Homalodisca vitripennis]|uniref:mucin-1-like n=1 Tax=Homalodisca vitripennis TaxID=197043 RepID=UPI001EEA2E43|nr:mucin-1-like [Homalodisca vitripennis]
MLTSSTPPPSLATPPGSAASTPTAALPPPSRATPPGPRPLHPLLRCRSSTPTAALPPPSRATLPGSAASTPTAALPPRSALTDTSLTASTPAAASPAVTAATPTHSAPATPAAASTLFESSAQHSDLINENVALKKKIDELNTKLQTGAAFLDISDLSRHHFTAHGFHLTTAGKAILADLIVKGLNSPPRTFNRTPAESAPRPPLPPTPPPPPTSAQGHNTYAEAVTQRPAGASTLPTTKTFYGVNKNNAVFLGTPDTSAGLN